MISATFLWSPAASRPFKFWLDVTAEACTFPRAGDGVAGVKAAGAGEKHENLSADDADRYAFDRDSLHFSASAAVENASQ